MELNELLKKINYNEVKNLSDNIIINGITIDSNKTRPGDLFVCIRGNNADGHNFAYDAYNNGANVVICDHYLENIKSTQIIVDNTQQSLIEVSNIFYNYPSKDVKAIAVTGTNGKTTVSHILEHVLEQNGEKCGLIGTLGYKVNLNDCYHPTQNTTPQANELQSILNQIRTYKSKYCVFEASSHAISQNRIGGINIAAAIFTNLTQDHLDYHVTMQNYFESKAKLFKNLTQNSYAIINADDKYSDDFLKVIPKNVNVILYGINNEKANIKAHDIEFHDDYTVYKLEVDKKLLKDNNCKNVIELKIKLSGLFNVYNSLAAISCAIGVGNLNLESIKKSIEEVTPVRGRFEIVNTSPLVIVDYAHTPDGLENVLKAAKALKKEASQKLICLFGCGGDRDATKRPKMGKIADELADIVVITSDNPRSENPDVIISDILTGIKTMDNKRIFVETDRKQAIEFIPKIANINDIIVIAGKGHETYQILKDKTIHFDDREIAQDVFPLMKI